MGNSENYAVITNRPLMFYVEKLRAINMVPLGMTLEQEIPFSQTSVQFVLKHGVSLSSWGEQIYITISIVSNVQTSVQIMSKCIMPTQIVDWGKNSENISTIARYLEIY